MEAPSPEPLPRRESVAKAGGMRDHHVLGVVVHAQSCFSGDRSDLVILAGSYQKLEDGQAGEDGQGGAPASVGGGLGAHEA